MTFARITLLAAGLAALAPAVAPATCTDERQGNFLMFEGSPDTFFVSCWPVKFTPATTFQRTDGTPVDVATLSFTDEVKATGCIDVDGFTLLADSVVVLTPTPGPITKAPIDAQVVIINNGMAAWQIQTTTDPAIGTVGVDNPTLTLEVGNRYTFSSAAFGGHPFQLIAKGATSAGDTVVLASGATAGSLEADPSVDWVDSGNDVTFTVSPALQAALDGTASQDPGYRCQFHPGTMRGGLTLTTPSGVESWLMY